MEDVRVDSWNELDDVLNEGSWDAGIGRRRSRFAFRGSGDVSTDLRTSLARFGGRFALVERNLTRTSASTPRWRVNERTLFPGLDGLSRWLARYYGPRGIDGEPIPADREPSEDDGPSRFRDLHAG
jgi:hypothetical protein